METSTEVLWARRLEGLKESGLTISAFAKREGLAASALSYWKRRLASRPLPVSTSLALARVGAGGGGLAAAAGLSSTVSVEAGVELVLGRGLVVRVRRGFDPQVLGAVVSVLSGTGS